MEQKFFILMRSSITVLSFLNHIFGIVSKNSPPNPRSSRFLLHLLTLLQFSVLYIGLWSTLSFFKGLYLDSLFWMWMSSRSNTTYWKDCLCAIVSPLLLCQRSVDWIYVCLFLGSLCCPIDLFVSSLARTTLSWWLSCYSKCWSQECQSPALVLPQCCVASSGPSTPPERL